MDVFSRLSRMSQPVQARAVASQHGNWAQNLELGNKMKAFQVLNRMDQEVS